MYRHATLGGTFDKLHLGHQKLLDTACSLAEKVTIGLTLPPLYQQKVLAEYIEDYETREANMRTYLHAHHMTEKVELCPLSDMYGTTLTDSSIDAIIVTKATAPNAERINTIRTTKGLPSLAIVTVPFITGDDNEVISSERIRRGEIDRRGHSYQKSFLSKRLYLLPDSLRKTLREPIGEVYPGTNSLPEFSPQSILITIGDVVSQTVVQEGYQPAVSIIDGITRRRKLNIDILLRSLAHTKTLENPAGMINKAFVPLFDRTMQRYLNEKTSQLIKVEGEEDLLALPAILLSPLQALILYGQHDLGIVAVTVTEQTKHTVEQLLKKF